ncbi:hypothetical protein ASL22_15985 [Alcaligenes faecalis]|nr:hypothetical protein ASL22_15985 [Alcaligenes faecalis]
MLGYNKNRVFQILNIGQNNRCRGEVMKLRNTALLLIASTGIVVGGAAQAGSVTISSDNPRGEVHFNLSCTFPDGEESEVAQYIIRGERSESYEEDGCKNFNARFFKISHNGEVTYRLKAGHSYTFQWMGTYWDLFED